jgi:hypothetical protein
MEPTCGQPNLHRHDHQNHGPFISVPPGSLSQLSSVEQSSRMIQVLIAIQPVEMMI